jgi:hypothetical protein
MDLASVTREQTFYWVYKSFEVFLRAEVGVSWSS